MRSVARKLAELESETLNSIARQWDELFSRAPDDPWDHDRWADDGGPVRGPGKPRLGSVLRIRLPKDYRVRSEPGLQLHQRSTNMTAELTISPESFDLVVAEETGGKAYYQTHYTHFEWPEGASGPTVAIGYDCGYVTPEEVRADWTGIVSDGTVSVLARACGLKSEAAHQFVRAHGRAVTISWEQALQEFREREVPKWLKVLSAHLSNLELLPPTCLGVLFSLAYNRGPSFDAPGPRFAEMRAIKAHMAAREFDKVPQELLHMRRLWPSGGDLWRRRGHEAALWVKGLREAGATGALPGASA